MSRGSDSGETTVVQLVANPAAGGHCVRKLAALAAAFERLGASVIRSECGPGRGVTIDPRTHHLCVVGGDGTVRHAAQAVHASGRPIGLSVYPAGTINLLHREAPCDLRPDSFAERVVTRADGRNHYAAELGADLFLACASVGPDSAAVAALSPRLKRRLGRLAYGIAFLKVLAKWPRPRITLHVDDRTLTCEAFYVAKSRYFAGPWSFAPSAHGSDPRLHLVALTKASRVRYLFFLVTMLVGWSISRVPGVVCLTCTRLQAESDDRLPVQADGDIATHLPIAITLRSEPLFFV